MKNKLLHQLAVGAFLVMMPASAQAFCGSIEECQQDPEALKYMSPQYQPGAAASQNSYSQQGTAPGRQALNYYFDGLEGKQIHIVGEDARTPTRSRVYYEELQVKGNKIVASPVPRSKDCNVTAEPSYVTPRYMNFHLEELAACISGDKVNPRAYQRGRGTQRGYGVYSDPYEDRSYPVGPSVPEDGRSTEGYSNQRAKEFQLNQQLQRPAW